jgi:hypothetical protein
LTDFELKNIAEKGNTFDVLARFNRNPGETTVRNKSRMTRKELEGILTAHRIGRKWWKEWQELVRYGIRPSSEFRYRVDNTPNFARCFATVLTELSKGLEHKFPPPEYQVPEGYKLYC